MSIVTKRFLSGWAGRPVITSLVLGALLGSSLLAGGLASSQVQAEELTGAVQGAGSPIAGATVTLYAAGEDAPKQLAQVQTGDDGTFRLDIGLIKGSTEALEGKVLYLVAKGGTPKAAADKGANADIALMVLLERSSRPR